MKENDDSIFGDIISSYSRAQAIDDGVLCDLTQWKITKTQWKMHVACTSTVWEIIDHAVQHGKDVQGVLADIYLMARLTIRGKKEPCNVMTFRVLVLHTVHELKMHADQAIH
jgi:hypothetical protein